MHHPNCPNLPDAVPTSQGPAAAAALEDTALFHGSCRAVEGAMEGACVRGEAQAREMSPLDDPQVVSPPLSKLHPLAPHTRAR